MNIQNQNPIPRIRIAIPPQMPEVFPKLILGMPPLPLSIQEPFTALKQRPEGGAYAAPVGLRGTSVGGHLSVKSEKSTNRHRGRRSKTDFGTNGKQAIDAKTEKTKVKKRNNRKLLRGSNGKFTKKGK